MKGLQVGARKGKTQKSIEKGRFINVDLERVFFKKMYRIQFNYLNKKGYFNIMNDKEIFLEKGKNKLHKYDSSLTD